jgi:serine/threonine protein kinase
MSGSATVLGEKPSIAIETSAAPQGRHSFVASGTKFVIDRFYSPLKVLGSGAYGVVCACLDTRKNKKVAVKKVKSAFTDLIDAKRIVREIKLLRHFRHENIIAIKDMIEPKSLDEFDDIYIVFEFMESDLHKIIYSKNQLTDQHFQYFTYQILRGLKYIHSASVIHRDLKPSNLLVNSNCDLKICDFGLARGVKSRDEQEGNAELTEYVVTRWYRAPEVMCSSQHYDEKIDVWSTGCILAELILRKPLFRGDDYIHQMKLIFELVGTPEEEDMNWFTNPQAADFVRSLPRTARKDFKEYFNSGKGKPSSLAVDLLEKLLVFNPKKRISVDEALEHPYFKELHNAQEEKTCKSPFNFDFERRAGTKLGIQGLILEEVCYFRQHFKERIHEFGFKIASQ